MRGTYRQLHVGLRPAHVYRQARGGDVPELDALRGLWDLLWTSGYPVERAADPECWAADDDAHGLRVTARVVAWRTHALVVGVSVRPLDDETLAGAEWTHEALEQLADTWPGTLPRHGTGPEAAVVAWDARAVDAVVEPETWRYRSGLTGVDVSLRVVRRDAGPLIVNASARALRARGGRR